MNLKQIFFGKTKITDTDWLTGIMPGQLAQVFMNQINDFLIKINEDPTMRNKSIVTLKTGDSVNLIGVAKICALISKNNWQKSIEDYLAPLVLQQRTISDYMQKAKIFLNVQSDLRIRIVSPEYDPGAQVVSTVFMEDLLSGLYLDTGNIILGVTENLLNEWGLEMQNLQSIALTNLRNHVSLKSGDLTQNNVTIKAGFSSDLMASGYLNIIPNLYDYKDASFIAFAIPSMDYILYQSNPSPQQIELLHKAAQDIYSKATKPLTKKLLVFKSQQFTYLEEQS